MNNMSRKWENFETFTPTQTCVSQNPHDKAMLNIISTEAKHVFIWIWVIIKQLKKQVLLLGIQIQLNIICKTALSYSVHCLNYETIKLRFRSWILFPSSGEKAYVLGFLVEPASVQVWGQLNKGPRRTQHRKIIYIYIISVPLFSKKSQIFNRSGDDV